MNESARLRYETTDGAIWITLEPARDPDLPDGALLDALYDAFVRARLDPKGSAVVLRLAGGDRVLDAGWEGAAQADPPDAAALYRHLASRAPVFEAIDSCPKTTIAVLAGPASGLELEITLLCDLLLAARDASLCFGAGTLGLCDGNSARRLPRRVGLARAKELLFTARPISAEEALQIGLANRVSERDGLDAATAALVAEVLTTSPTARRSLKEIMQRELPALSPEEHYASALGPDLAEGLRALRERRPPAWRPGPDLAALVPSPTRFS